MTKKQTRKIMDIGRGDDKLSRDFTERVRTYRGVPATNRRMPAVNMRAGMAYAYVTLVCARMGTTIPPTRAPMFMHCESKTESL